MTAIPHDKPSVSLASLGCLAPCEFLSNLQRGGVADPPLAAEIAASTLVHVHKHGEQLLGSVQIVCRTRFLE